MIKKILKFTVTILAVLVIAVFGCGLYMLNYSLAPEPDRENVSASFMKQFEEYPETKIWVDSLCQINALHDTILIMPAGDQHHAYYVDNGSNHTALILHGWRDCSIDFFYLARLYNHEMGYNVVMPDAHAAGLSEGKAIQMGWLDKEDVMLWLKTFQIRW